MLSHIQIWTAIDLLADKYGLSASGLARKSGLDATSFNRSKRRGPDGRDRWPSTESISKILNATGASLEEFYQLLGAHSAAGRRTVPMIGLSRATSVPIFGEGGAPAPHAGWDSMDLPDFQDDSLFALAIQGEAMMPVFRDGDAILLSRNAEIHKGDRLVIRTQAGEIIAGELRRRNMKSMEFAPLTAAAGTTTLQLTEIDWVARIVWARQ